MSDLLWLSDKQMAVIEPFFPLQPALGWSSGPSCRLNTALKNHLIVTGHAQNLQVDGGVFDMRSVATRAPRNPLVWPPGDRMARAERGKP